MSYEAAKRLADAGNKSMFQHIGLYSVGEFTRVQFFYKRDEVVLRRGPVDSRGSLVSTITTQH
jgi:hypothetical protein